MEENKLLTAALRYANLGLRVHPLLPGDKRPALKGWPEQATRDEAQIKAWWTENSQYNIGIATGNSLLVVDLDRGHQNGADGFAALEAHEAQRGTLPPTWTVQTPSGGQHLYYRTEGQERNRTGIYPGVDVRGKGGYVVAPPSILPNGAYKWLKAPGIYLLAEADQNVRTFLNPVLEGFDRQGGAAPFSMPEEILEGQRVNTLVRLVGALQAKGLGDEAIRAAVNAENEDRCVPPLTEEKLEQEVFPALGRWAKGTSPYCAANGSFKPEDFSDAGNATAYVQTFQGNLIYTDALGWLYWNGQRWERDDHRATALALWLTEQMLAEAQIGYRAALHAQAEAQAKYAASGDEADGKAVEDAAASAKVAKAYLTWAGKSRDANRVRHMIDLAKPALVVKADQLDAEAFDLNTPGGIVDLRTGQLRPHDRGAFCSRITGATPGEAGTEMWAAFLETITCGNQELQNFLQIVAGMAAIGTVYQEGIIIAYGGGRNGKSTFFNALGGVLGDYTGSIDVKTLTTDRGNKGAAMATLRGRRLVVTGELEEHQRLSVATLKQLASTDALTIEEKFKAPETVRQSHTLTLFTNHLPRVGSTDAGTWRRLIVVPFNATIPENTGIQNYADELIREAGGAILQWVVEGAVRFARARYKLTIPAVVSAATDEYRQRENWLANFIRERCVLDASARVGAAELYREYREWAESTGDYVRRLNDFDTAMEAAGFQKIRPRNKKTWTGVRIDLAAKFGNSCAATG